MHKDQRVEVAAGDIGQPGIVHRGRDRIKPGVLELLGQGRLYRLDEGRDANPEFKDLAILGPKTVRILRKPGSGHIAVNQLLRMVHHAAFVDHGLQRSACRQIGACHVAREGKTDRMVRPFITDLA